MTRIDLHAHVTPPEYLEGLRLPDGSLPPLPPATVEGLTATMERHGIDAAVISPGPPGVFFGDQGRADDLARTVNEVLAGIARDAPARFAALATLPLPDVGAALAELAHALDVLGMDGVWLPSHVAGTYLGDPAWDTLFDELHRRKAYVFVHPALPPYAPPAPHPVWLYEFPFETTRAIASLIYSGTFERCPDIKMQFAHLGGTAPFLAHRLASLADREAGLATAAPAGALEYLRRQYYDTGLSNHELAVKTTLDVTGLDHVVFGTDYPYAALPPEGRDPAPELAFLGTGRAQVDAGNAARLVPRLVAALQSNDQEATR
ncbi:amidohydrolase family protein [Conexibacter woesei]|uniref:amidohydrolase family protein n=1 Tax=Conexibacter woesei TaxID=191495 RepID=UPI0004112317|nr:amidohydrolase family protein [Conexibacter woesei]